MHGRTKNNNGEYRFGGFCLDLEAHRLTRDGHPVALKRKSFELLALLVESRGRLLSRTAMMEAVWPGRVVQEQNLTTQMHALRKALDDNGEEPLYIETVRGIGYRFIAPVTASGQTARAPQTSRRLLLGAIVLSVLAIVLIFAIRSRPAGVGISAAEKPADSVAVLPFTSIDPGSADAGLAHAISAEVASRLSHLHELRVVSPSAEPTADASNPLAAGRQLGVSTVLSGTIQIARLVSHANIRLIDTRSGITLWAASYNRDASDLLQLESDITEAVAGALDISPTTRERLATRVRPTRDAAAYESYLRGVAFTGRAANSRRNYANAADLFSRAVKLDPGFALAWARLGMTDINLYLFGYDSSTDRIAQARKAIDEAIRLAPNSGVSWLAEGEYRFVIQADPAGALRAFLHARASLPANAQVLDEISYAERCLGRWNQALEHEQAAAAIDPWNSRSLYQQALTHVAMRDFSGARVILEQALDISPDDPELAASMAATYQAQADLADAERALRGLPLHTENMHIFGVEMLQLLYRHRYAEAALALRDAIANWSPEQGEALGYYYVMLGQALELKGKPEAAIKAWREGRQRLAKLRDAGDKSFWLVSNLGLLDAYLGNARQAVIEGRQAIAMTANFAVYAPSMRENLARIELRLGHKQAALDIVPALLKDSYGGFLDATPLTRAKLRLDPTWKQLQDTPGFSALLSASPAGGAPHPAAMGPHEP